MDPDICIGSGGCVRACPEQNVLGLINNRGTLIEPANCIGHGMCQAACPVDALTLVFGTERRGVDIPL
jgi:NAD-dependent dihydropyrimidine dehydrogenase PreA subunit